LSASRGQGGRYLDALSDVLNAVRLSGGVFLDAEFTAPWCVNSRVGPEDCRALGPVPAHLIAYHYVLSGSLVLSIGRQAPRRASAGAILLLPRNDAHVLGSAPDLVPEDIDARILIPSGPGPATLRHGGGGQRTHIICGFLGCEVPENPLLDSLPATLQLDTGDGGGAEWIRTCFQQAAREFAAGSEGSSTVLAKLAELLFAEAVRRYMASMPPEHTGWLAGLADRAVGRALALLHRRPGRDWTTDSLAREVGLSRSAFAQRFTTLVGMPPRRYLSWWRLQLAAARLREGGRSTAQIAEEVGYASEAALGRAFRRAFGTTPGAWRRGDSGTVVQALREDGLPSVT
jgi:AraC-like DNA-binding protein